MKRPNNLTPEETTRMNKEAANKGLSLLELNIPEHRKYLELTTTHSSNILYVEDLVSFIADLEEGLNVLIGEGKVV